MMAIAVIWLAVGAFTVLAELTFSALSTAVSNWRMVWGCWSSARAISLPYLRHLQIPDGASIHRLQRGQGDLL
jgi:hypothetical protein